MSQSTHASGRHGRSHPNQNSAEKSEIAVNNIVDGLHHDGSQNSLLLDEEFLESVALFMIEQTLPIHQIYSMGLKSGLLTPATAEQTALNASFISFVRLTKAPFTWKDDKRAAVTASVRSDTRR
jgi:hypothetical protein